jgi:hypothetical protein
MLIIGRKIPRNSASLSNCRENLGFQISNLNNFILGGGVDFSLFSGIWGNQTHYKQIIGRHRPISTASLSYCRENVGFQISNLNNLLFGGGGLDFPFPHLAVFEIRKHKHVTYLRPFAYATCPTLQLQIPASDFSYSYIRIVRRFARLPRARCCLPSGDRVSAVSCCLLRLRRSCRAMMAAMEKSVAQGRRVQFSSMVCNSMESASFEPRYCHFRTTWGFSLLVDMTQTLTSHYRFPASSVIAMTYPCLHYHHHSWQNMPLPEAHLMIYFFRMWSAPLVPNLMIIDYHHQHNRLSPLTGVGFQRPVQMSSGVSLTLNVLPTKSDDIT